MQTDATDALTEFQWTPQPEAAQFVRQLLTEFENQLPEIKSLGERMLQETGTRLIDWIDHFAMPVSEKCESQLASLGFESQINRNDRVWSHPQGMFPEVVQRETGRKRLAIKVENVTDFQAVHRIVDKIKGDSGSPFRRLRAFKNTATELAAIERHGFRGFHPISVARDQILAARSHYDAFRRRERDYPTAAMGFDHAAKLIRAAIDELGTDWACDLFFAAEREYWQRRNRAAQIQKERQDALGLGWANHDHHTYRCSREEFARLVAILEELGFVCRERFYGGAEAGWGAQVLEQPNCRITIFADVDLSAEEVAGDFAHEGLSSRDELGTVGLWCALHGEAFLQAGMHHLECQFDFESAQEQLRARNADSMKPFTDFDYLKQCFTAGEIWKVSAERIAQALANGHITEEQAVRFQTEGVLGSHLEILERNDGYKGFNQTGISEIIAKTDPRKLAG